MSSDAPAQSYALGYNERELNRLLLQSRILGPMTTRMLSAAGLKPGMRVLDAGCGPGDVSLIAAKLVGPTGSVVGLDRDERSPRFPCTRRSAGRSPQRAPPRD